MPEKDIIIEVNDVYKNFRVYFDKGSMLKEHFVNPGRSRYEEREILKGISFKVYRGETLALIGQNGCGKSTTLKMLTKILYPNKGSVTVNGKVSSLIELGAGFHPDMSGRENIYINASILGIKKEEVDKRIDEIIRFSELEEFIDNPIRTYSSGMYMRLAFSVAINVDADILLIDEILAVGDQAFQEKCIRKLEELRATGVTVVLVSHSMGQIKEIADRCIWIEGGQIREDGDTETVCNHYEEAMTRRREERDELEEEQRQSANEKPVEFTSNNISSIDKETKRKIRKTERERLLQERREWQKAFSVKWQGGGSQGKPLAVVAMIALMVLLSVCTEVFMIGYKNLLAAGEEIGIEAVMPLIESSLLMRILGYGFFTLGRISMPMLLILLGFEILPGDYSSGDSIIHYYKKTFIPFVIIWEVWVVIYNVFLYFWEGKVLDPVSWLKEALLIKYVDLSHAWMFRFVLMFMLIAPFVAMVLQMFSVGLLRFFMLIVWVLIFLFPGLDLYGQANGGDMSFPQSLGTFCYFYYFCLGFYISRYVQRIFKGSREVLFFIAAFVLTTWSQIFLEDRGIDYLVKPTYFGISVMALFGFDLLVRFKVEDMYPKLSAIFRDVAGCAKEMIFIFVPVQMVLTRHVFHVWQVQESRSVAMAILMTIGLWIVTFAVSFVAAHCMRKISKIFAKD